MLKGSSSSKAGWKVFIMDKVTVKVMSASCKMSDITDQQVSRKNLKFDTIVYTAPSFRHF
ncbi:hypothetical protein OSB04_032208 [Centaurea solstitialis]|uniref:Uncharacterized protein n=1 Tax=Centaurea solstitialis TaxID=347529 RepID=A0AA38SB31_9ASTR|nr:hypothetical protein OSB04_032208 [Centaurea solstitialis]